MFQLKTEQNVFKRLEDEVEDGGKNSSDHRFQSPAQIQITKRNEMKPGDHEELIGMLEACDLVKLESWIKSRKGKDLDVLIRCQNLNEVISNADFADIAVSPSERWNLRETLSAEHHSHPKAYGLGLMAALVCPEEQSTNWNFVPGLIPDVSVEDRSYLVKLMLERGADPNFPPYIEASPVPMAAAGGHQTFLNLLFEKGLMGDELISNWKEVDQQDPNWRQKVMYWETTPTLMAAMDCKIDILKLLQERQVDIRTPPSAFPIADAMLVVANRTRSHEHLEEMQQMGFDPLQRYPLGSSGCMISPFFCSITGTPTFALKVLRKATSLVGVYGTGQAVIFNYEGIEISSDGSLIPFAGQGFKSGGEDLFQICNDHKWNYVKPTCVLNEIVRSGDRKFFNDVLIRHLLQLKWKTFAKKMFFLDVLDTILYALAMTLLLCCWPVDGNDCVTEKSTSVTVLLALLVALAFCCFLKHTHREVVEFQRRGSHDYLREMGNWIDILLGISTLLILGYAVQDLITMDCFQLSWPAILLGFVQQLLFMIKLTEFCSIPKYTGPLVVMVRRMMADVAQIGTITCIFFFAHSNALYMLLRFSSMANKYGYIQMLSLLYMWFLGDYNITDIEVPEIVIRFSVYFCFISFTLLLVIIVLNMLIAMMGNTYQAVAEDSENEWLMVRAERIMKYQANLKDVDLQRYRDELVKENQKQIVIDNAEAARLLHFDDETTNWASNLKGRMDTLEEKLDQTIAMLQDPRGQAQRKDA